MPETTIAKPAPAPAGPLVTHPLPGDFRGWHGPARPPNAAALAALLLAALISAVSVPFPRVGVGWLVTAVAGVAALVVARPRRPASRRAEETADPKAEGVQPEDGPAAGAKAVGAQGGPVGARTAGVEDDQATGARAVGAEDDPATGARAVGAVGGPGSGVRAVGVPVARVAERPYGLGRERFAWTAASVAFLAVGTFRAAGWLFVLCVLAAVLTSALAVAGGRSGQGMIRAIFYAFIAIFRAIPWLSRGAKQARQHSTGLRVGAMVGASAGLLLVFGALFSSADAAFASIVRAVMPSIRPDVVVRWLFFFGAALLLLGGAAFLRAAPPVHRDGPGARKVARLEWAVPLSLLTLLFALFVSVQLTVLFGGAQHVLRTDGLTYAEYARSGFWQLLVVTGLTLLVLAAAARRAPRGTATDRILIRVVLGALAVLTLMIVASALHRMQLYADAYGLTRLRVLVAVCEFWLGAVFVMILLAGVRLRAPWLPRAVVGAGVIALLGLAAANPDLRIAEHNVARYERTGKIDVRYLSGLSADAAPALDRLPEQERRCALDVVETDLELSAEDWRSWNLARENARKILEVRPADPVLCS